MAGAGAGIDASVGGWATARLPMMRPLAALRRALEAERDRWFLWLPVFLGIGIGVYFSLTVEPPLWIGLVAVPATALGVAAAYWSGRGLVVAIAVAAVAMGFAAAQIETLWVAAPVLSKAIPHATVEGKVVEVEPVAAGRRILIEPHRIGRLDPAALPARIRITLRHGESAPAPGAEVSLTAALYPPPGPAMPGAYDFQRRAYFDRLGAVGYAIGRVSVLPGNGEGGWQIWVAAVRARITERILAALPGRDGAIAAAIITGETHAIPERDAQAFRDAGLAHILVIAGLHMGLVAGLAFLVLRSGLALVPWLALRSNTKKGAAALALLVTFAYMLLSGATVSSRRSFVMTALVLLAILVDRMALSARGLAWAALAIMLASPFSAVGPSFQMSFAAVSGLVAFYETFRGRFGEWHSGAGLGRRIALYLLGVLCTTVVSTLATAPFTEFHFNRFPIYSAAANAIAVPLTGIWVIPWAMLSCVLMPFGLEQWSLVPMGWGIEAIAEIAIEVSSWPSAAAVLPSMPVWGLALLSFGGFWLCVWRRSWRLIG
ncbi:MAG TPA: ComEC/Rec2 family competence protein, partial [Stellaceae bacterium]|nr:ComEC/Rec2 family competence protein [Stellaceae bacterium]